MHHGAQFVDVCVLLCIMNN